MSATFNNLPRDDFRFDRLVDGELSEAERRELLAGLDNEPGGWRRCALAFLEAQCWKQEFAATVGRDAPDAPAPRVIGTRRSRWLGRFGTPVAMAAGFLVALWLGAAMHTGYSRRVAPPTDAGPVAGVADVMGNPQHVALPSHPDPGPWRMVTVSAPSGGQDAGLSFNVPAVERENIDPQWLQSLPSPIPDNVLQALNRTGHRVQQRREFVHIPLQDGRRLVVPVDQVDVKYVPEASY